MRSEICVLWIAVFGVSFASYEGFKVYQVTSNTEIQNVLLKKIEAHPDITFWSKINRVGKPVSIMVPPKLQNFFEHLLVANGIVFDIQVENVESTIQAKKKSHSLRKVLKSGEITFEQYLRHEEMNAYLEQLAEDYPDIVTVETIGQSYEGRDMNAIHITSGSLEPKPIIFIDAGIHALEWAAPAVALYVINQLVENSENSNLIIDVEWIILPSLNPDGYVYTWDVDYLWRKTRSPGVKCVGVDGNRNFDFHWLEMEDGVAVSRDECSQQFVGKEPFSEIETRNFRNFFNKTDIAAYVTLHSYGQYLVYPWGYGDVDILPDNWEDLDQLAHDMGDAISAVRGTNYTIGETAAVLYPAGGASDDWAMGVAGIPIVYTIELPGGGFWGFDLPESEIQGVVEETFEAFKILGKYVAQNAKKI